MRFITHDSVLSALTPAEAVDALRRALATGYDPATDQPRTKVPLHHGELHILPSALPEAVGVKILSLHPAGYETDLPLIQGQYLLFDAHTLTPTTLIDGTALTAVRTPAVSLAGVKGSLTGGEGPLTVVIFGTGAQGQGHARTVESVMGERGARVSFVSRSRPELAYQWYEAGSPEAAEVIKKADLIVCATTASAPILRRDDVRDDAVVVAVGSHTCEARELASDLVGSAHVVVEDPAAALAEAGDVTLAIGDGVLSDSDLIPMKDVVRGDVELTRDRPIVFKTVGMPWEDLVIADAVARAAS
ncbi:ornithine cyclodeaminase family protein [Corynebacterium sp.]|uniref:ornithine cyclodeaminase family protein n=1 Tax=Corynebacterium sp. TaxID=1720 RepID=UPI0026DD603C|nr:ornithine cyclodeaminase family protein [Corynebacterium sp.]MDO5031286.1 ornithine cyclodeaminase family protein [Corynebacterium sp.]